MSSQGLELKCFLESKKLYCSSFLTRRIKRWKLFKTSTWIIEPEFYCKLQQTSDQFFPVDLCSCSSPWWLYSDVTIWHGVMMSLIFYWFLRFGCKALTPPPVVPPDDVVSLLFVWSCVNWCEVSLLKSYNHIKLLSGGRSYVSVQMWFCFLSHKRWNCRRRRFPPSNLILFLSLTLTGFTTETSRTSNSLVSSCPKTGGETHQWRSWKEKCDLVFNISKILETWNKCLVKPDWTCRNVTFVQNIVKIDILRSFK